MLLGTALGVDVDCCHMYYKRVFYWSGPVSVNGVHSGAVGSVGCGDGPQGQGIVCGCGSGSTHREIGSRKYAQYHRARACVCA